MGSHIASQDRDQMMQDNMEQISGYVGKVREFFREADTDGNGTLSWDEFRVHLSNPRVKAYFQALDLDVSQAHCLFTLLDEDGSDEVSVKEFLDGCLRLRGEARNIDLNMLVMLCQVSFKRLTELLVKNESRWQRVNLGESLSSRMGCSSEVRR